jgi:hypothetical protein
MDTIMSEMQVMMKAHCAFGDVTAQPPERNIPVKLLSRWNRFAFDSSAQLLEA